MGIFEFLEGIERIECIDALSDFIEPIQDCLEDERGVVMAVRTDVIDHDEELRLDELKLFREGGLDIGIIALDL